MNAITQPIDLERLPVMTYLNQSVATGEMLAHCFGTNPEALRKNFSHNRSRFIEGKHFITLEGPALKEFQRCVTISDSPFAPSKFASKIVLWTKRGTSRHAKILNTDQAWEVFEAMEDAYFQRSDEGRGSITHAPEADLRRIASLLGTELLRTDKRRRALLRYRKLGLTVPEICRITRRGSKSIQHELRLLETCGLLEVSPLRLKQRAVARQNLGRH